MIDHSALLINVILYLFLPLWGIAACIDWYCHKVTKIEENTGLKESILHSVMGIQVGIPIFLCLLFQVNLLILGICAFSVILHEFVAHMDVKLAVPEREISVWEMHAHSYLATIPIYLFVLILIINWDVLELLMAGKTEGQFRFQLISYSHGGDDYLPKYLAFTVLCAIPYIEELVRCLRYQLRKT